VAPGSGALEPIQKLKTIKVEKILHLIREINTKETDVKGTSDPSHEMCDSMHPFPQLSHFNDL